MNSMGIAIRVSSGNGAIVQVTEIGGQAVAVYRWLEDPTEDDLAESTAMVHEAVRETLGVDFLQETPHVGVVTPKQAQAMMRKWLGGGQG